MDEPLFADKQKKPQDADLAQVLGKAKGHWDNLTAHISTLGAAASPEWKHYGKKSGWILVVRGKRTNLMYLVPREKSFGANFALGEKAVQAAFQSDLPAAIIEMIRQSPKYPEGRAVRLTVASAADVKTAKGLLAIKLNS